MKATELRIGNWVTGISGQNFQVSNVTIGHLDPDMLDDLLFKPIQLTEEWLLKFGFISDPYNDTYIKGSFTLNCDKTRGKLELWPDNVTGKIIYIKHVHQLQNIYFALTGEELQVK